MHTLNSSACTQSEMLNNFVIMLSEESNIHAHPQTHVATPSLHPHVTSCLAKVHHTTPRDSNPCGQSPMEFESISITARTQCLVVKARNIRLCTTRRRWIRVSSAPMSTCVPSAPRYILCVDATAPRTWTYTQTHTQTTRQLGRNIWRLRDN